MKNKVFSLKNEFNGRLKLIWYSAIIGIITGFIVVLYRISLDKIVDLRQIIMEQSKPLVLVLFFISAILTQKMMIKYPLIRGTGIVQVMALIKKKIIFTSFFEIIYKFIGGVLGRFIGLSLGMVGPSIYLGSSVGESLKKITKNSELEEKKLISAGSSAGLTAAFNAPISGIVFTLEELNNSFSITLLLCTIVGSISSSLIVRIFLGKKDIIPNLHYINPALKDLKYMFLEILLILILSVIVVIIANIFDSLLLITQKIYNKIKINSYIKLIIVVIFSYILVIFLTSVTGSGRDLIEKLIIKDIGVKTIIILFIFKFIFTAISHSTNVPGGLFIPSLLIGALIGKIYGIGIYKIFNLDSAYIMHFIVISMVAYFTAIIKAPFTAIVLVMEITGNYQNIFSISLAALFTYILLKIFKRKSMYTILYDSIYILKKKKR
ncbi:ClC family H(+)/Cl(-) exchange transporter [Oceanivirga salmonicida]|uniref:ClC family H(+)/Cl(-) exchange transporter n=1 Tax=Oceanivirga salmonicida TaxID=1769291 RepID=UPI00082D913B|nr:ClC family H(+)/Cl(-) exchange transporter [Oceanivirga salmonicida]